MYRFVIPLILITTSLTGVAEFRTWSNPDKTKSFEAEYVSSKENRVTVRLKSFKSITLDINKLHIDDQLWIKQRAAKSSNAATNNKSVKQIDENAIYDTLVWGDNRDTVTKKLFASKLVSTKIAATHIGRTGLNNIFTTHDKIAGLTCSLTFNWSPDGELIEVTLQSEDRGSSAYSSDIKSCWNEFEQLLTYVYGKPKQATDMPTTNELKDDQMLASHVWRLEQGGSILLGTSKMNGSYQAVVRFTKQVH